MRSAGEAARGRGEWSGRERWNWDPIGGLYPVARLTGTLVRIALLVLLTALVMFVARTPVEQIADRVAADPVKSWVVGFLAEMLFVPVLVMTIVVLAISIIGIPLLLLVPVAIVAAIIVMLVGFTGVAYHLGRLMQERGGGAANASLCRHDRGHCADSVAAAAREIRWLDGRLRGIVWTIVGRGARAGVHGLDRRPRRGRARPFQPARPAAAGSDPQAPMIAS